MCSHSNTKGSHSSPFYKIKSLDNTIFKNYVVVKVKNAVNFCLLTSLILIQIDTVQYSLLTFFYALSAESLQL